MLVLQKPSGDIIEAMCIFIFISHYQQTLELCSGGELVQMCSVSLHFIFHIFL